MVCFPSNQGVDFRVMKNWLPLVLGPAFAIDTMPANIYMEDETVRIQNVS